VEKLVEPQVLLIHFLSRLTGDGVSSAGGTSNIGAFFGGRAGRLIIGTEVFPPLLAGTRPPILSGAMKLA